MGYYDNVTGELEKYLETLELWKRTYPRDVVAAQQSGSEIQRHRPYAKALDEAREAIRLDP